MGENILKLRALEPEDIDMIYKWENDPKIWEHSSVHQMFSRYQLTQYIMSSISGDFFTEKQLRLVAEVENEAVGCIDLFNYDPFQHRAELGLLVDERHRRKGYGKTMIEALINYARIHLQLHQIYCVVPSANRPSMGLFRNMNFTIAGQLRDWVYDPDKKIFNEATIMQKVIE